MTAPRFKRLNVVWDLPERWCETDYIAEALAEVERLFGRHEIADRFIFVATPFADRLPIKHRERVIVIQTSDEEHGIPNYLDEVFMVFKCYRPFVPMPENLRIIPAGCNKDVPAIPGKPIDERSLGVFFSGQSDLRADFFAAALPLNERTDIAARIVDTHVFRGGMSPADYGKLLADTKIALCPRGVTHETFRIYEAMRAGCIIVAARQMPTWFTDGWPAIEVDDWVGLDTLVDGLLNDQARLHDLSQRGRDWWQTRCAPEMVGRYIANEIVGRLTRT